MVGVQRLDGSRLIMMELIILNRLKVKSNGFSKGKMLAFLFLREINW